MMASKTRRQRPACRPRSSFHPPLHIPARHTVRHRCWDARIRVGNRMPQRIARILIINWHRISQASPPAPKPANTSTSPRFSCIPSSDDAAGSAAHDTTNATPRSSSPLRPCPSDDDPPAASRTPGNHPCATTPPPTTFRTAARKSPRCGRQPQNQPTGCHPPPLPPPSTPTHPAACHAAAPAGKSTSRQTQSPPPAGLLLRPQCALRPPCNPLADRRDTDPKARTRSLSAPPGL